MNEKPKMYVYLITNTLLNKQYIGSHTCYNENDNYMGSSKYLNDDYKIYGKENFIKEIINDSYENKNDLLEGETQYILEYNTLSPNGYNRFLPNERIGFHMSGIKHSEETKNKLRKPKSEDTKNKISKSHIGLKRSVTMKEKAKMRKWINNGQITMSVYPVLLKQYINTGWNLGRLKFSDKHKENISKTRKEKGISKGGNNGMYKHIWKKESLEKLRSSNLGKKHQTKIK